MDKVVYSSHYYRYSFLLVVWYQSWCKGVMCFMTQTFFFALFFLVQINSSHFLSRCLSHFFSLGRRRRRRRRRRGKDRGPSEVSLARKAASTRTPRESARHRCGGCFETKKRVVFFFFFEERRQNHRFSFGRLFERIPIQMADDAPTPTQQKPTTHGGETAPSQTPTAQQNQNPLPVVAQEPEVDRSVHPSGIVPVLQCVY